jgi:chemotaxis protein CheD
MTKKRIVVDISDAKISDDPLDILTTYSLGSCVGVCLYDAVMKIGGLLHYQLPTSTMDPQRAIENPFMFADTGMKILVDQMLVKGVNLKRMQIKIAGGAAMDNGPAGFDIGKRNHLAIRKIFWKNGMLIEAEDIGGSSARNLYLNIDDGMVTVRSSGLEKCL